MVDPKKDYELLMRYLQGGTQKSAPAAPEQTTAEAWQPPPAPSPEATPYSRPAAPSTPKIFRFHWPGWKPVSLGKGLRIAVAALSFSLLVMLLWKVYAFYQLSPDAIFDKVYVPYSVPADSTATKNSIAGYYASGNYVAATLQAKKQKPLLSDEEKLLAGLSYLHRDDYPTAIRWLEPLANNFKSSCRQQAEFYLALTFLKNEDYDRCIERMEHIVYLPTHLYHDRVSSGVISDIKMLKWK